MKLHFTLQALLDGKLTQTHYLLREQREFIDGDKVTSTQFQAGKRLCCITLVEETVKQIKKGNHFDHDWRHAVRQALNHLGYTLSKFADVAYLNSCPAGKDYPWTE